jgi:hypothetical protein
LALEDDDGSARPVTADEYDPDAEDTPDQQAERLYQRALGIFERLGQQDNIASTWSQLGILEKDRGGPVTAAVTWHVKSLGIRLRLGTPKAAIDLRQLASYRLEIGAGPFTSLLLEAAGDTDLAETITSLLDQLDKTDDRTP